MQKFSRDVKFMDFAVSLLSVKFYNPQKEGSGLMKQCIQLDDQQNLNLSDLPFAKLKSRKIFCMYTVYTI